MNFFTQLLRALFKTPVANYAQPAKPAPVVATPKPVVSTPNPNALPISSSAYADGILDVSEVYQIAKWLKARHAELAPADPYMAAVMATTESGGNSRRIPIWLTRFEPLFFARYIQGKISNDKRLATSYGIMQVMLNTAIEDYNRGFRAYGKPTAEALQNPYTGIYFGMAHQVYIRKGLANRGLPLTEKNIVMSYNGGIGANNSNTQNHYNKYASNKGVVNNAIA